MPESQPSNNEEPAMKAPDYITDTGRQAILGIAHLYIDGTQPEDVEENRKLFCETMEGLLADMIERAVRKALAERVVVF
jgi:hypothetical protein